MIWPVEASISTADGAEMSGPFKYPFCSPWLPCSSDTVTWVSVSWLSGMCCAASTTLLPASITGSVVWMWFPALAAVGPVRQRDRAVHHVIIWLITCFIPSSRFHSHTNVWESWPQIFLSFLAIVCQYLLMSKFGQYKTKLSTKNDGCKGSIQINYIKC